MDSLEDCIGQDTEHHEVADPGTGFSPPVRGHGEVSVSTIATNELNI